MQVNLSSLREQIEEHLRSRGIAIFQSLPRAGDLASTIYWDTGRYPEFKDFLAAADAAGVRMVTLFARELDEEMIEDTLGHLGELDIDRDERRAMEKRLQEMRAYAGFTCEIELSFDVDSRVYVFDLRTDWYADLQDLVEHVQDLLQGTDDDEDEENDMPLSGGYFPRN
jgi:hypothetical protein